MLQVETAESIFSDETLQKLQHVIPRMLRARPWFLGKQRYITGLDIAPDVLALAGNGCASASF